MTLVAATAGIVFQESQKMYRPYFGTSKATLDCMLKLNHSSGGQSKPTFIQYLFDKCVLIAVNWQISLLRKMFRGCKNIFGSTEKNLILSFLFFLPYSIHNLQKRWNFLCQSLTFSISRFLRIMLRICFVFCSLSLSVSLFLLLSFPQLSPQVGSGSDHARWSLQNQQN